MLADQGSSGSLWRLASVLSSGIFVLGLALSAPALAAGGGSVGVGSDEGGGLGGGGGAGVGAGGGGGGLAPRAEAPADDLTTCNPGHVWDRKKHKCLRRHSGVLPNSELTEYAYALAKADRFQEALDVLDSLDNPNTPRALNYRGYAARKLGRTDEGIGYYLQRSHSIRNIRRCASISARPM